MICHSAPCARKLPVSLRYCIMPGRKLIINADDLGYNQERDQGIFQCFTKDGSISCASILANGVFGIQAAENALRINLPLGLHFNITEGIPLVEPERIPSLVQGKVFVGKKAFVEKNKSNEIKAEDVKEELRAQINWFISATRSLPRRVDGHQHAHVMPCVREAFCEILNEFGITETRLPLEEGILTKDLGNKHSFFEYVDKCSNECLDTFSKYGIEHTDKFIGSSTMGSNMSIKALQNLLLHAFQDKSKNLTCELMVHPGFRCTEKEGGCGIGPDGFSQSNDREHEMMILCDPMLKEYLKGQDICLIPFIDD